MSFFTDAAEEITLKVENAFVAIEPVDAIEFLESKAYLGEKLFPFQSLVVKILYNLFWKYGVTEDEQTLLDILKTKWGITIDMDKSIVVKTLVLSLGRRSTKSSLSSFLATYAMYTLICRGNPQAYYGIRERHPVFVVHVAAAGKQAESVFTLTQDNIKKCAFFRPYIDFDKDNTTELRLYSPYDVYLNQQLKARNAHVPRGTQKENRLAGSLNIKSITTSAASNRGDAIFMLIMSEFAHFPRAKTTGGQSLEQIMAENPRTDYAIAKALVPALLDFGSDGKVIYESSPAEKGGEFYRQYCIGGGKEQEEAHRLSKTESYQVIQLATWEARPSITREELNDDFLADPGGARMEYGAHFSNPSGQYITEATINRIPKQDMPSHWSNPGNKRFIVVIDAGGKAKKKVADTYAIGWGYAEDLGTAEEIRYVISGMHGFRQKLIDHGGGNIEKIPVNPNEVMTFLLQLLSDLGGRNYITEICYDQWENTSAIATLQELGYPAIETTFTNPYKAAMYGNFLTKAELGLVDMYGNDDAGWVGQWKLEMKYLQQHISGNTVYYRHPSTGPVQTDDFADVTANLVHRLTMRMSPTKESTKKLKQQKLGGQRRRATTRPVRVNTLVGGSQGNIRGSGRGVMTGLADRLSRK